MHCVPLPEGFVYWTGLLQPLVRWRNCGKTIEQTFECNTPARQNNLNDDLLCATSIYRVLLQGIETSSGMKDDVKSQILESRIPKWKAPARSIDKSAGAADRAGIVALVSSRQSLLILHPSSNDITTLVVSTDLPDLLCIRPCPCLVGLCWRFAVADAFKGAPITRGKHLAWQYTAGHYRGSTSLR